MAFDGDGHYFRLASEALRIHLVHLFDPYAPVNASHIEPLPHQLTPVYETMLECPLPLRFLLADEHRPQHDAPGLRPPRLAPEARNIPVGAPAAQLAMRLRPAPTPPAGSAE